MRLLAIVAALVLVCSCAAEEEGFPKLGQEPILPPVDTDTASWTDALEYRRAKRAAERKQQAISKRRRLRDELQRKAVFESITRALGDQRDVVMKSHLIKSAGDSSPQGFEKTATAVFEYPIQDSKIGSQEDGNQFLQTLLNQENYGGFAAGCFAPALHVELSHGKHSVDVLVCLGCKWVYIRVDDAKRWRGLKLSYDGLRAFGASLKRLYPQTKDDVDRILSKMDARR